MKVREESQQLGLQSKEVLSDYANNIKNLEWLMTGVVESIYDLEDE